MEELAAVVAAVRHAGVVESRVGAVHLLLSVTLHEQIDRHHPSPLRVREEGGGRQGVKLNLKTEKWIWRQQERAGKPKGKVCPPPHSPHPTPNTEKVKHTHTQTHLFQ